MAETDSQTGEAPGPGWYDDPKVPGRRRWWTGSEWGPVQRISTESTSSSWTRRSLLPIAVFAVGWAVMAVAIVLLWQPVTSGGLECGSLISPLNPTSGLDGVSGYNAAVCSSARTSRLGLVGVLTVVGIALIIGGLVLNGRQRSRGPKPPPQRPLSGAGGGAGGRVGGSGVGEGSVGETTHASGPSETDDTDVADVTTGSGPTSTAFDTGRS